MPKLELVEKCENVFDPDAIIALTTAYDRAIARLHATSQPEFDRETIAKRILAVAARGERNSDRLCRSALAALGIAD
jgi:hypothetical protein